MGENAPPTNNFIKLIMSPQITETGKVVPIQEEIQKDKRKKSRGIRRFQGDHAMYFLFADAAVKNVSEMFGMKERETAIGLFSYYVSKFITYSSVIVPSLVSVASKECKFNYTTQAINRVLKKMYELKLLNKYAGNYVINRDTIEWVRQFTFTLTRKMEYINKITFYNATDAKLRARSGTAACKSKTRKRIALQKKVEEARLLGTDFNYSE